MKTGRRLTFRIKMMGIAGITVLAFVAIVASSALLGRQVEQQLTTIQVSYVPKLDLEAQLDAQLERLARGFQDAVATRDTDVLAETSNTKARFADQLKAAGAAVDPIAADHLRVALDEYYAAAYDLSRRLIADETGEGIVAAATEMQKKQARVADLIKDVAALDRRALADAFAASVRTEARARTYQRWIGIACLASVLLLSFAVSRGVLRAVSTLSEGLGHFGKGDFRKPILVSSRDELGDVADHANQMAASLERLSIERATAEANLKAMNRELEAFSYSVAHDLRAPLRGINGLSHALLEDHGSKLDEEAKNYLRRIATAAGRMGLLIDALLAFSRLSRTELKRESVDISGVADAVIEQLRSSQPERAVEFVNQPGLNAYGDPPLVRAVLENLLGNAWKFTSGSSAAQIVFGAKSEEGEASPVYFVRDNGAGFDMAYADKLFAPFQRLHTADQFAGTGIGLATVQRIVERHGGRIRAEGAVGQGAKFEFTLPKPAEGALS